VLRTVLTDALLVGGAAAIGATVLAQLALLGLSELGVLTAFGVRLSPVLDPLAVGATLVGAMVVVLTGATLATGGLLLAWPGALLDGTGPAPVSSNLGLDDHGGD
jgi:hypothetical protein